MKCESNPKINSIYIVNYEDVKIKDGYVTIKRKYKEKKRPIYKVK